ncbi:hypothetical protein Hypma_005176 [Hypsizygus marmoreus]|uniref:Uncharacterized protein n=1 Tax=Hypsizygus marmoreus TaxID=39966 RepID=A0A369J425_HYPMA|nr:hypothetical protein Hypma_005176 [Hypsizygus marmoreus]
MHFSLDPLSLPFPSHTTIFTSVAQIRRFSSVPSSQHSWTHTEYMDTIRHAFLNYPLLTRMKRIHRSTALVYGCWLVWSGVHEIRCRETISNGRIETMNGPDSPLPAPSDIFLSPTIPLP